MAPKWGQNGAMNPAKPEPSKFNLRMPPALRAEAEAQAEAMGVSLNAYCLLALRKFLPAQQRPTAATAQVRKPTPPPTWAKAGRNEPCPCGSGLKSKHCHGAG